MRVIIFSKKSGSTGVQQGRLEQYVELVKKVGLELRSLLGSVDQMVPYFPAVTHREVTILHSFTSVNCKIFYRLFVSQVEMAHKVLSKDMAELVSAMKLAEKYSTTTLDAEYRK